VAPAVVAGGKGQPPAKGGKAAPAKGAAQEDHAPSDESTETSSLDFSSSIEYKLVRADTSFNTSRQAPSLYLQGLDSLIRLDLRYAQFLTMIQKKHQEA